MIAEKRERAPRYAVKPAKQSKKTGLLRNPWLCRARRHKNADAQSPHKPEPWLHRRGNRARPVIAHRKIMSANFCRHCAGSKTAKRLLPAASQDFDQDLAWCRIAENYKYSSASRLEQRCQAAADGLQVFDTVQARKIGEGAIEAPAAARQMPMGKWLEV